MVASRRRSENTTGGAAAGRSRIRQSRPAVEKVDAVLVRGLCEVGPVCLDGVISAADT